MSAPFKQMENIGNYIAASEAIGVRKDDSFQTVRCARTRAAAVAARRPPSIHAARCSALQHARAAQVALYENKDMLVVIRQIHQLGAAAQACGPSPRAPASPSSF
jgi:hypothetical protein